MDAGFLDVLHDAGDVDVLAVGDGVGLPDFTAQHLFLLILSVVGLGILRRAFPGPDQDRTFALVALGYLLVVVRGNFSNNLYTMAPNLPYHLPLIHI